jgi:hypothetical protein
MASRADVVVFNKRIRAIWPVAAVGFAVTLDGKLVAPSPKEDESAQRFLEANGRFLTNTESAEVYQQSVQPAPQLVGARAEPESQRMIARSVSPQKELKQSDTSISNVLPAEADFRQLIGTAMSGSVARFVGNELFAYFGIARLRNPTWSSAQRLT